MALTDWINRLKSVFGHTVAEESRRPDGGTSCYRPLQKKTAMDGADAPQYAAGEADPSVSYVHTGFTGMTPPVGYGEGYGSAAAYQQQMSYGQPAYGQPAYGQTAYGQTGGQSALFSQAPGWEEPNARAASRPDRGWFPPREEKAQNNISYMPGFQPDAGSTCTHVEHIMSLTGLRSCYEAIECMKNGETLIVTMDSIANDGESMRCQDMLAGAAFTLGCSVRFLQSSGLVLIAPEGVKILPEQPASALRPDVAGGYAAAPETAQQPVQAVPRRERRSGSRAEEYQAARNGERENYNPYTGTMPVAAGAYGAFGGYGY